jgi:hypothetical protein
MTINPYDFLNRMKAATATMQSAPRSAVSITRAANAQIEATFTRWDIDSEAKAAGAKLIRTEARAKLSDVAAGVKRAQVDYAEAFDLVARAPHKADAAKTPARIAAWSRMRDQLDTVTTESGKVPRARALLERAAAVGDTDVLEAAHHELAAYLNGHGSDLPEPDSRWLSLNGGPSVAQDAVVHDAQNYRANYRAQASAAAWEPTDSAPGVLPTLFLGVTEGEITNVPTVEMPRESAAWGMTL